MGLTTSKKLIRYENGKRKLEKQGFKEIKAIHLIGGGSEPGTDENWRAFADINIKYGLLYFCFDDAVQRLSSAYVSSLVKDLARFCNFKYGIGYQREFKKGPEWYVSGIIGYEGNVTIEREERARIAKWHNEYFYDDANYKTGDLRDVYPYNVLTSAHLSRPAQETNLKEWIESACGRGDLTQVVDDRWLWTLKDDQIPPVQEALHQAGLLLCYKA